MTLLSSLVRREMPFRKNHCPQKTVYFSSIIRFKGSVSSSMPCTCRILDRLCWFVVAIFMGQENGDKQRPTKRRHVQSMLDETDPLTKIFGCCSLKFG